VLAEDLRAIQPVHAHPEGGGIMSTIDILSDELRAAGFTYDNATRVMSLRGAKVLTTKIHRNAPEMRWLAEVTIDGCRSLAYGHSEAAAMLHLAELVSV
jgi:hypothetical protein